MPTETSTVSAKAPDVATSWVRPTATAVTRPVDGLTVATSVSRLEKVTTCPESVSPPAVVTVPVKVSVSPTARFVSPGSRVRSAGSVSSSTTTVIVSDTLSTVAVIVADPGRQGVDQARVRDRGHRGVAARPGDRLGRERVALLVDHGHRELEGAADGKRVAVELDDHLVDVVPVA